MTPRTHYPTDLTEAEWAMNEGFSRYTVSHAIDQLKLLGSITKGMRS